MRSILCAAIAVAVVAASGCATRSSSKVFAPTAATWQGPVFVTQGSLPAGVEYKVVGSVQADERAGYDSVTLLYPLLANEARKIGANAVINAQGGRRMTAFSWSAPHASGLAVRVEDVEKLKTLPGALH